MDKKKFGDLVQTGDGSYTILDRSIDEEYHSTYGARSEADELYMINSGFREEIQQLSKDLSSYQILDVGIPPEADEYSRHQEARTLSSSGDHSTAVSIWKDLLEQTPNSPEVSVCISLKISGFI